MSLRWRKETQTVPHSEQTPCPFNNRRRDVAENDASSWQNYKNNINTLCGKLKNLFVLMTNLTHFFNVFISFLYMFRATQCSSSGESIVSIHHLVYITLCRWPSGMPVRAYALTGIPDGHLHRVIYTRWCIDTIDSPDDEHWVARNMYRSEINTLKKVRQVGH